MVVGPGFEICLIGGKEDLIEPSRRHGVVEGLEVQGNLGEEDGLQCLVEGTSRLARHLAAHLCNVLELGPSLRIGFALRQLRGLPMITSGKVVEPVADDLDSLAEARLIGARGEAGEALSGLAPKP